VRGTSGSDAVQAMAEHMLRTIQEQEEEGVDGNLGRVLFMKPKEGPDG
jgi:hypothetical protein